MSGEITMQQKSDAASSLGYITGSGTALFGGLTANDIAALGGLLFVALTFFVNLYYKHKMYKLEKEREERKDE